MADQIIQFEGAEHHFPADFSQADIAKALKMAHGDAPPVEKPSLTSDALKYSPVGMVQSLADAIRDPRHAISSILDAPHENAKLLDKAKESYRKGDFTGAAAHFLNYLVPGGSAFEDAGQDFANGDVAHGVAKTAGLATTMVSGAKAAPVIAEAGRAAAAEAATIKRVVTNPDVIREGIKVFPKGAQAVKFGDAVIDAAKPPQISVALSSEIPETSGPTAPRIETNAAPIPGQYDAPRPSGPAPVNRASLPEGVNPPAPAQISPEEFQARYAAEKAAAENPDAELLDGIAQGTFKVKNFAAATPEAQAIIRRLADATKAPPRAPRAPVVAPEPPPEPPEPPAPVTPAITPASEPAAHVAPPEPPPVAAAPEPPASAVAEDAPTELEKQLQDSLDEMKARKAAAGEAVKGANRVKAANRWRDALNAMDMKAPALDDDAAWARLARNMGERKGYTPSADTRQLIHERMGQAPDAAESALRSRLGEMLTPAEENQVQSGGDGNAADPGKRESQREVSEPVRPAQGAQGAASGNRTSISVPGEARRYAAGYEVRELSDLQPSHHGETFQRNPHYAIENDRNYDNSVNQRKIVDWSAQGPTGFDPRNLLNTAPDSSIGPPVIDSEGNVIGGNGRTMIAQRVYKSNPAGAQAYRAELDRTAGHYGIDPESYAHMKQPVLVRTIDDAEFAAEGSKQRAVTDFNKTGTASLTPSERAIADSRGVSLRSLDDIASRMEREGPDATLSQVLEGKSGIQVLQNLTKDGVISPQEAAGLGSETKLTKAGKDRISGLMLGRFFTDARQLDFLPDAIRNKMERIAAPLARVEGSAEYSLSPHTRNALNLLEDAEAHGASTLDDHLAQSGLFSNQQYSPEAVSLAQQLRNRDPLALTNAIRGYAEHAKYAAEYQGPGMSGEFPAPLTPAQAFEEQFGPKALAAEAKVKAAKRDAAAAAKAAAAKAPENAVRSIGDLANLKAK